MNTPPSTKFPAPLLAIVVPCYNEQQVLPITIPRLLELLTRMEYGGLVAPGSYILAVNDGSRDETWQLLKNYHMNDGRVRGISLAHNRGHQFALLAGLESVINRCDAAVSIDADLQDDPEAIVQMVQQYRMGAEIVYGVRSDRGSDTAFKRTTARGFYRFQQIMGLETVYDHADYRLMSNRALEMLSQYGERNLFLRGIVPQLGLKTAVVTYVRGTRAAGESKYPLGKMLSFAVDGVTSFSARPMRWIFVLGMLLLAIDLIIGVYVLASYFFGNTISGWASLMLSVWFLGSVLLISLGIIGEYVGKIFVEVKHRPRYFISERID